MSLNNHEYQEHTHETFNNPVSISCEDDYGLKVINTIPGNKLHRIVLGKHDYPASPSCGIGFSRVENTEINYLYMKVFGLNHGEIRIYENNITINNISSPIDKTKNLYNFDLCKWIVDVNKAVFGKEDLFKNSHDYVYEPNAATQTEQ